MVARSAGTSAWNVEPPEVKVYSERAVRMGRRLKSCSDTIPTTACATAAGICGSLMLAMCCSPLTSRWCTSVWKASRTWRAEPEKSITVALGEPVPAPANV